MQKKSKLRKWLRRVGYTILFLVISISLFLTFVEELFEYVPPTIENMDEITAKLENVQQQDDCYYVGDSWSKKEKGLQFLYTKGDPFTIGYSSGKLVGEIAPKLEDALLERVYEIVGSEWVVWLFRKVGYCLYSDLQDYFPQDVLQEVYGYSQAIPDKHPELGSSYFRALNYQAAHDTGHRVMENVLQLQGCTSFAAWGNATKENHLIVARNFDFEIGDVFDRFKMVHIVVPEKGIPFISVSWPGMSGAVSGVNQKLLAVTINAGKSDHAKWKATPVTVVTRKILQEASTIEEAIEILRKSDTYVSESFLIADGKEGRAVVVEKSPQKTYVRNNRDGENTICCANHFLSNDFQSHLNHNIFVKEGSSPKRLERIRELIATSEGKIDAFTAANILRDYKLKNDISVGMSHLHSINPSICSHSIIMDLTAGILWVNVGPNQSGEYVALSITDIFTQNPQQNILLAEQTIPEDKTISPKQISLLIEWRNQIKKWQKQEFEEKEFENLVQNLQNLNADHFLTMVAYGDFYYKSNQYLKARDMWEKALENHPYGEWINEIKERLQKVIGESKDE